MMEANRSPYEASFSHSRTLGHFCAGLGFEDVSKEATEHIKTRRLQQAEQQQRTLLYRLYRDRAARFIIRLQPANSGSGRSHHAP